MADKELEKLRGTVEEIDGLAQSTFAEIEAVARLALAAMENPNICNNIDAFARAFESIRYQAADRRNLIGVIAEGVGCGSVDDAQIRRWAASREAQERVAAKPGARGV